MAGIKHPHSPEGEMEQTKPQQQQGFMHMFESFRSELDEHQERRERVIKTSRDTTALSKKIIFALQRTPSLRQPLPEAILKTITPLHNQITALFTSISSDLRSINTYRYARQMSPGTQEFIEAISFQHYLTTQTLLTYESAQEQIPGGVLLTEDDYLLGLYDMTGELMRFAITGIATGGVLPGSDRERGNGKGDILADLRALRMGFEGLDLQGSVLKRDVEKKMSVMRQSVEKVESAAYGLVVRGSERPKGWVPDFGGADERREAVESY